MGFIVYDALIKCTIASSRSSKKSNAIEISTYDESVLLRIKEFIQILDPIHNAMAELSKKGIGLFVTELSIELMLDMLLLVKQSSLS
ncbi:hypothetical protein BLOT_016643 [Blomia tropicalis]|nr:hypothetical protein BLOT_016643 [Blomia tropicalis]